MKHEYDPGSRDAITRGCRCRDDQPADPNTWAIAVGCPLHDNLPTEVRDKLGLTRKAQAEFRGVPSDDEWQD